MNDEPVNANMAEESAEDTETMANSKEKEIETEEAQHEEDAKEEISEDYKAEYDELCRKFNELNSVHETMIAELESLKEFKLNVEKQETELKIEYAIKSVSDNLTQEQVDEWRQKANDYANVDEFTNAIKAYAFDIASSKKGSEKQEFNRIHIPNTQETKKESSSVWDRID
jgi:hypothetical protein